MAAAGGVALLLMILSCGFGCMIPAAAGLIGCKLYQKRTGKAANRILRIVLWGVLIAGIAMTAVPAMYFYLILANW